MASARIAEIKRLDPRGARTSPVAAANSWLKLANDPGVDCSKLQALLAADARRESTLARRAYVTALAEMARDLPVVTEAGKIIVADRLVGSYALWEDINEVLRPLLASHGFVLSFRTSQEDNVIAVTAVLDHCEGHQETTSLRLPPDLGADRNSVQAVGSTVSYGKRYAACALLNITTRGDDDDGRTSPALLSPDQMKALEDRLNELKTKPARLLRYLKVDRLELIPSVRFEEALAVLSAKAQGQEGGR